MKKLYIIMALMILGTGYSFGQCTPNTSMQGYIYPETIEDGVINTPYSQTIYFRVPSDTTVQNGSQTVPVHVVDTRILDMEGRPASFGYACNVSTCIFNGGTYGCAVISGTPGSSEEGHYAIKIRLKTNTTIFGSPVARIDSGVYEFAILRWPASVGEVGSAVSLNVYPNPSAGIMKVKIGKLTQDASLRLLNMNGSEVLSRAVAQNESGKELTIESALPDGIYLLQLSHNGTSSTQKVVIRK